MDNIINFENRKNTYTKGKESILKAKIRRTEYEFNRFYLIEKEINKFINYKRNNYKYILEWGSIIITFIYVFLLIFRYSDFRLWIMLTLIIMILLSPVLDYYINIFVRQFKIENSKKTLKNEEYIVLLKTLRERYKIIKSIKINTFLNKKYLIKYLNEDIYREYMFEFMYEYISNHKDATIKKAIKYSMGEIKRLQIGIRKK